MRSYVETHTNILPMTKHSTLLYFIDNFKPAANQANYTLLIKNCFDPEFLNALMKDLDYDPGDELVKKVLLKANL